MRRFNTSTAALAVAMTALFVALGGPAWALSQIGGKRITNGSITTAKLADGAVTTKKIANGAVSGSKMDFSGVTVPNATNAANADHATNANHATNADNLGGQPASAFKVHCPSGMMPSGGDCIDFQERSPATLIAALATCARVQLHLADAGELAQLFDRVGAPQGDEWTGATFVAFGATTTTYGQSVSEDSSRQIGFNFFQPNSSINYRCATSATN